MGYAVNPTTGNQRGDNNNGGIYGRINIKSYIFNMGLSKYAAKYHGTSMLSLYSLMVFPVASGNRSGRLSKVLGIWGR